MSIKRETVEQRKALPLASGVLDYFPDALLVVAEVSRVGNEQHHPGSPLHWDKSKSQDEADALLRHLMDRGTRDTDGLRHSGKVAWRALALLQRELDAEAAAAVEPGLADGTQHGIDRLVNPTRINEAVHWLSDFPGLPLPESYLLAPDPLGGMDGAKQCLLGISTPSGPSDPVVEVDYRGEWPPDTRWNGLLMCCWQTEHALDCPQYRD